MIWQIIYIELNCFQSMNCYHYISLKVQKKKKDKRVGVLTSIALSPQ